MSFEYRLNKVMDVERVLPTRGQLERQISQTTQSLYREWFGHNPSKVVCHIFSDKVAIVVENAVTHIEKLLITNSQIDLAEEMRSAIERVFSLQVKQKIGEILNVETLDLILESRLDSEYVGMVAILSNTPELRSSRKNKILDTVSLTNENLESATLPTDERGSSSI